MGVNNNDGIINFKDSNGREKTIPKKGAGRPREYVSPFPQIFALGSNENPQAIKTEIATEGQIRPDERTLIWGLDDAEPTHILDAIAKSPTTTNCVGKIETYTKGSGFSDPGLQDMPVNEDGDSLWDLHCAIVQYYSALDGFSVNFKYNRAGKIISAYNMAMDSCRLAANADSNKINFLKYNPYFGTIEYQPQYTTVYPLFNIENIQSDVALLGDKYEGQAYFHGTKRTLYKHYPVPKFWSGKKWIYADAKLATYIDKLLDNGFFESVLMKVIGDPNRPSNHPDAMREVVGTDGVKRMESFKTEGQIFNEMMAKNFSGVEKAAKAMVMWSLNKDQSVSLEAFPANVDANLISTSLIETIRMISISTEVPAILANLPNQLSSLSSGGDALKNAIEFMQANTAPKRTQLEKFYNNILLPNMAKRTTAKVKIVQYSPITTAVTIDEKSWEVLTPKERREFARKHVPGLADIIQPDPIVVDEETGEPLTVEETQVNEKLTNLTGKQQIQLNRITRQFTKGEISMDQAKLLLKQGFGFSDLDVNTWLGLTTEL